MTRYPLAWLTTSIGGQPVACSNYWTANIPQKITIKSVRVAVA